MYWANATVQQMRFIKKASFVKNNSVFGVLDTHIHIVFAIRKVNFTTRAITTYYCKEITLELWKKRAKKLHFMLDWHL